MKRVKLTTCALLMLLLGLAMTYQPISPVSANAAPEPPVPGVPTVPLYRLFAHTTGIHFYTTDVNRKLEAMGAGWTFEGIAAHVLNQQDTGTVPLYVLVIRLRFNNESGDAVFGYTTSEEEKDQLLVTSSVSWLLGGYTNTHDRGRWRLDSSGIAGYIGSAHLYGTVPLYRLYHPPQFGPEENVGSATLNTLGGTENQYFRKCRFNSYDNLYTTSEEEKADALLHHGYKFVRIEGYVWPQATTVGGPPKLGPGKPIGNADTVLLKWGCTRPGAGSYNCPTTAGYEACENYRAKGEVKACSTSANQKVQAAMEKLLFNVGCSRFMNRPDQFLCKTQKSFDLCETYRKNGTAKKCLLTTK